MRFLHRCCIRWISRKKAIAWSPPRTAANGVTIAVRTVPNRALASNPLVLTTV